MFFLGGGANFIRGAVWLTGIPIRLEMLHNLLHGFKANFPTALVTLTTESWLKQDLIACPDILCLFFQLMWVDPLVDGGTPEATGSYVR